MKTELAWSVDSNAMLIGARIHDGIVTGLSLLGCRIFSIDVLRTDGSSARIEIEDIEKFAAAEIWESTIVSEIFIWKIDAVETHSSRVAWLNLLRGRMGMMEEDAAINELKEKFSRHIMVHISCSYGGSIFAVGNKVRVYEIH